MSDDVPNPESFQKFWLNPNSFHTHWELRQLAAELIEALRVRGIYSQDRCLLSEPESRLVAIADRAAEKGAPNWTQGSLLALAARAGDPASISSLLVFLKSVEVGTKENDRKRRAIVFWQKQLARINPTNEAEHVARSFRALQEAIALDRAARVTVGSGMANFKLVVTVADSADKRDSELKAYRAIFEPLRLWRSDISVRLLAEVLTLEYPHLAAAAKAVAEAMIDDGQGARPAVVLIGPSAVGKDSLWRRAAALVKRPMLEFDLAGTSDNRTLRGTSRGWGNRMPSLPVEVMARQRIANPFLLLSELDKAGGSSWNGRVFDTLLSWLEPEAARNFLDEGLGHTVDLGSVTFGFTANTLTTIPSALRTRLRIIEAPAIGRAHVDALMAGALRRRAEELGVAAKDLPSINRKVVDRLRTLAGRGSLNLRGLGRVMRVLFPDEYVATSIVRH